MSWFLPPLFPLGRIGFPAVRRTYSLASIALLAAAILCPVSAEAESSGPGPVQISSRVTLSRHGKPWLRMSDFPVKDAVGADLGHKEFGAVQVNPAGTRALVVGIGENHQWLAMVEVGTGRIIETKRLTEAGVTSIVWDPLGTMAAVSVAFGSGKEGIVLMGADGAFTNVGAVDSGARADFLKNPRWSADGTRLRATGRFLGDTRAGELEFERASRKLHRASDPSR